jgi:hypothetical protein
MSLKTDLSDMSISSVRASIGRLNVTLKIWNEVDNTMGDPIIEEVITEDNVKIYVEGVDPTDLAERVRVKIKGQAQSKIDYYQNETEKIDNVTSAFQAMVTTVDGELQSRKII